MSKSNRIPKSISWLVREIRFLISLIFLFILSGKVILSTSSDTYVFLFYVHRKLSGIGILSDLTHVFACFDFVEIASSFDQYI